MTPIAVYARKGSFWRGPKAAPWSWCVIVRDEKGNLLSDPETVRIMFGPEFAAPKQKSLKTARPV